MKFDIDREVRLYGDSILKTPSEKVTEFGDDLKKLAEDMTEILYDYNGLGLAGPQVGVGLRMAVIDLSFGEEVDNILVLVNPEIEPGEMDILMEEGCLSVPGVFEEIARPESVKVNYQDIEGNHRSMDADGLLARVIQHEVDHLNGVLFIDRLSTVKRSLLSSQLKNISTGNK